MTQEEILNAAETAGKKEAEGSLANAQIGVAEFDVQSVLDRFKPKDEYDIFLPDGTTIKCKAFRRVSERKAWEAKAANFWRDLPRKGTDKARAHPYADVLPETPLEANFAHLLHTVSVEPKVTLKAALSLNECPDLMLHIQEQIDRGNEACYIHAMDTIRRLEGNDSSATPTTGY